MIKIVVHILALTSCVYVADSQGFNKVLHDSLKDQFSQSANDEFQKLMKLAINRPGEVFARCSVPVKAKSACYGSYSQEFSGISDEYMSGGGCMSPSHGIRVLIDELATKFGEKERNLIIAKKSKECGRTCMRKLSCCRTDLKSFYLQGSDIGYCTRRACTIEPLTRQEQHKLGVSNGCDLATAGFPDWATVSYMSRLMLPEMYEITARLMCNIYGTRRPRMNCRRNRYGKCVCCCHDQRPRGGACVRIRTNECDP